MRAPPPGAPVCVGYSGGLDSTVLLDLLADGGREVSAVHVHHGLSPHAEAWAAHCERFCAARGIRLSVERVRLDPADPRGVEAAARAARYAIYAARPEPFVALAHHLDDQAETVLLQALRGAGLKGVAAMPAERALNERVTLLRPLLAVPREALRAHAAERGLDWVEDESNASPAHDRNFLRLEVAPPLARRFPAWRENLARLAQHAASADALLAALAALDGLDAAPGTPLALAPGLPAPRRANLIRAWLAREGLPMASEARLAEIDRQLHAARADARVAIPHAGAVIVRHRGHALVEAPALPGDWQVPWAGEARLALGEGLGEVAFERVQGAGIRAALVAQGRWRFATRRGGERLRLAPGRPSRTLKNLLQEAGVPAWRRESIPLLFRDGTLAWVPGIGVAAELRPGPGEPGLDPHWRLAFGSAGVLE